MSKATGIPRLARRGRLHGAAIAVGVASGGLLSPVLLMSAAGASTHHVPKSVVISATKNKRLGTLLVSSGKTLYTLKASKTPCNAACQKIWPEVVLPKGVTKATAGSGVSAAKLGTVTRPGGALQVTYEGKALYWFAFDKSAGQVNGNVSDTWGKWSDVVTAKAATSASGGGGTTPPTTSLSGGGGTAF